MVTSSKIAVISVIHGKSQVESSAVLMVHRYTVANCELPTYVNVLEIYLWEPSDVLSLVNLFMLKSCYRAGVLVQCCNNVSVLVSLQISEHVLLSAYTCLYKSLNRPTYVPNY